MSIFGGGRVEELAEELHYTCEAASGELTPEEVLAALALLMSYLARNLADARNQDGG